MSDSSESIDSFLSNNQELMGNFIAESKEHLDAIEQDFLSLERQKDSPDQDLLNKVFRAIHSVKGAAGFLGMANMAELAHIMETLLTRMRGREILPETKYIDALLMGVDHLNAMLSDIVHSSEVDIAAVRDRLSGLLDQGVGQGRSDQKQPTNPTASQAEKSPIPAVDSNGLGNTVRIHVDILDKLMVQAGELVLVRNEHLLSIDESDPGSRFRAHRLDLVTTEMQETIISTRMQPIGKVVGKFPRIVRDLGNSLGKQIRVEITGGEAELDKTILESLADPMTHLIRNCCGHGIESPEERVKAGKTKTGHVTIAAYHEAGRINIEIRDDGRGLDPARIRKKALEKGIQTKTQLEQMSDREILRLVFLPGFSTTDEASDVSGRGVGMDVVKTGIERLGGIVDIESTVGEGTLVHLRLPLTLAIISALIVMSGESLYAIPQISLVELVCLYDEEALTGIECADDQEVYYLRGRLLRMVRLSELLDSPVPFTREIRSEILERHQQERQNTRRNFFDAGGEKIDAGSNPVLRFVVLKSGSNRYGLIVDHVVGIEEIVVKPMHHAVKSLGIYSGATILGIGKPALILDVEGIVNHAGITMVDQTVESGRAAGDDELQSILLFKSGSNEQFAMPLPLIRRIVPISLSAIEQIGEREYITIDDRSTLVLRLDHVLNVAPLEEKENMYLILPRHIKRSVGILASGLIDIEETAAELDVDSHPVNGLLGTAILRESMTLFIDIYRLVEIIEPEWFAERRMSQFGTAVSPAETAQKILLLEDITFFRRLIKGYLEADGYAVTAVKNGKVGLDCMEETEFDLIVSDLEMPIMNGWGFISQVRQGKYQQDVRALALTALDSEKDRQRALKCGFDRYEVKLDRERFLTAVAELLAP